MARHRAPAVCHVTGCANDQPCPDHARKPWADVSDRRPSALTGRRRKDRNASVMAEHGGCCHVCGQPGADQIDHVVPLAHGGTERRSNLAPIHAEPCHRLKTEAESAASRRR